MSQLKALNKRTAPKSVMPERIIQFGEGNFLRAFVDWIVYNMDQKMLALNALAKSLLESRLPYEIFIEGTYSVQLVDTEKYLTQKNKNSNGTNYYAAFADIAAVQADATKNGVELSDYNWTFNFKKITKKVPTGEYDEATGDDITVDVEQTSIYNANGYVSELGYVIESTDETQAPAFRFFKQNQEDETFAIMNQNALSAQAARNFQDKLCDELITTPLLR